MLHTPGQSVQPAPFTPRRAQVRGAYIQRSASTSRAAKEKPDWTGDDALSLLVNAAIGFKPLYNLMQIFAKRTMQKSAESSGIPWRQQVKELSATQEVYELKDRLSNPSLQYPEYYLKPFHAYDAGNLDWTAAFEAEAATYAMAVRTWKDPALSAQQAQEKLRGNIFRCLQGFGKQNQARAVQQILDVGCSVGVSSRYFAERFPEAQVTGLDLSPFFLAVAEIRERAEDVSQRKRIRYMHALGERSGLPPETFDLVNLGFVIHECPKAAIASLAAEAFRVLRSDGVLLISDNNPRSETIQNLPPAIFTLMKSTEPWSDEYYQTDVEEILRVAGFQQVVTQESDHRHRAIMAIKP